MWIEWIDLPEKGKEKENWLEKKINKQTTEYFMYTVEMSCSMPNEVSYNQLN